MRIRLIKKTDIPQVVKLFIESYVKEEKEKRWEYEFAQKYITMIIRNSKDICFVATDGEKIAGVALCVIVPQYNKYILSSKVLLVHPDYRKNKVGTKLLRKICIKAQSKYEINQIQTGVETLSSFPISWYDKMGFRKRKNYEVVRANIEEVIKLI